MFEPKPDDVIIKAVDLNKVVSECSMHIFHLLKTAKHLHFNHNFDKSIIFAILAFEEFNKLVFFIEHQKNLMDVTRKELGKMNSHSSKLQYYIETERKRTISSLRNTQDPNIQALIKKANKTAEDAKKSYRLLNFIKQLAMYYDFRNGRTLTLTNQIKYDNLDHFSLLFLEHLMYMMNFEMLKYHYGNIDGTITVSKDTYENTDYWKNIQTFLERVDSPIFDATLKKFHNTMLELEHLHEYMFKNNLFV